MTTVRLIYDDVRNTIDYLSDADLLYYANSIAMGANRVSWHQHDRSAPFLITRDHPTIDQYLAWVSSGAYTAILFDGSLLQVTYDVAGGRVSGHRLAYIPCPYDIDRALLLEGEPLGDVVDLYRSSDAVLRSPTRFDYDPMSATSGHPAVHLTINSPGCRIACAAPMHVLRFVDFVFRYFYPYLWSAHAPFFEGSSRKHVGGVSITNEERLGVHLMWDVYEALRMMANASTGQSS